MELSGTQVKPPCADQDSVTRRGWEPGTAVWAGGVRTRDNVPSLRCLWAWELRPSRRKRARFSWLLAVLRLLCFICLTLTSAPKEKSTFTVTTVRGTGPPGCCVPAERVCGPQAGGRGPTCPGKGGIPPAKGSCPFQACRPPLLVHCPSTTSAG